MKTKIATDREQSKRLLACGVKPETADMSLDKDTGKYYLIPFSERVDKKHEMPVWSLSRLISLLPPTIDEYDLYIFPSITGAYWGINYIFEDERLFEYSTVSLIQTCVRAIEWLTANGYSLNNIE